MAGVRAAVLSEYKMNPLFYLARGARDNLPEAKKKKEFSESEFIKRLHADSHGYVCKPVSASWFPSV